MPFSEAEYRDLAEQYRKTGARTPSDDERAADRAASAGTIHRIRGAMDSKADELRRVRDVIANAHSTLRQLAEGAAEDREREGHLRAASEGARAYVNVLDKHLSAGRVSDCDLGEAWVVASAACCGGYLTTGGVVRSQQMPLKVLIATGFLTFFPQIEGKSLACYRLTNPYAEPLAR